VVSIPVWWWMVIRERSLLAHDGNEGMLGPFIGAFSCTFITWLWCFASDYRCEGRKQLACQEATLVPLDKFWLPLSKNPDHLPIEKETNRSAWTCIRNSCFAAEFRNCQILNHVVESPLFTSLWNRNHQWLPDTELIQMSAFFHLVILGLTPVSLPESESWFEKLKLSRNLQTQENDHLHIYSLWLTTRQGLWRFEIRCIIASGKLSKANTSHWKVEVLAI
jgi:hypothetical protein